MLLVISLIRFSFAIISGVFGSSAEPGVSLDLEAESEPADGADPGVADATVSAVFKAPIPEACPSSIGAGAPVPGEVVLPKLFRRASATTPVPSERALPTSIVFFSIGLVSSAISYLQLIN